MASRRFGGVLKRSFDLGWTKSLCGPSIRPLGTPHRSLHLLGVYCPDHKPLIISLQAFYGIGAATAQRIADSLHLHRTCRASDLSESQVTQLSSLLSAASSSRTEAGGGEGGGEALVGIPLAAQTIPRSKGGLQGLQIETELRRFVLGKIEHLRAVGTYRGRRHNMGYPVRGQRTKNNAQTAKKLNRGARRG